MSSLWSSTRAAVNTGYGMNKSFKLLNCGMPNPAYKKTTPLGYKLYSEIPYEVAEKILPSQVFESLKVHPELLEEPPYAQKNDLHKMSTRGGSLIKGSAEAKARMAYLRSLRGRGRGQGRCGRLRGGKSYNKAALRGGESFFGPLLESLGGTAMNAIKQLALETGASLTQLLSDPKALISNLMSFAPAAARAVKRWFSGESDEDKKAKKRKEYLKMLRKYDPELFEKKRKEAMKRKKEQERLRFEKLKKYNEDSYDFDNDYADDDEDVVIPKKKSSRRRVMMPGMPIPRKSVKRNIETSYLDDNDEEDEE